MTVYLLTRFSMISIIWLDLITHTYQHQNQSLFSTAHAQSVSTPPVCLLHRSVSGVWGLGIGNCCFESLVDTKHHDKARDTFHHIIVTEYKRFIYSPTLSALKCPNRE